MSLFRRVIQRLRGPRCPVSTEEKTWIEERFRWLQNRFGSQPLLAPTLEPTERFFPNTWSGTEEECVEIVTQLCGHMCVDPRTIVVDFFDDEENPLLGLVPAYNSQHSGAAGLYFGAEHSGHFVLGIAISERRCPAALIATICHELGHVHLLRHEWLRGDETDHEPLTDLLTVYFGAGIFTANSAFEFSQWQDSSYQGWSARRLGYLSEPMLGYALAAYAWMRGETNPTWQRYLRENILVYFEDSMYYLENTHDTTLACASSSSVFAPAPHSL